MSSNYLDVTRRLTAYREKVNKTQGQMGQMLGVTQSHYAKLEAGCKIISYKSLKTFDENGGDLCQLLTGKKRETGFINKVLEQCDTMQKQMELLRQIFWTIEVHRRKEAMSQDELSPEAYKSIFLFHKDCDNLTVWERIRKNDNLTQVSMAALLDINVKRYRRIEKGLVGPDAEILYTLYQKLYYSPLIFFDKKELYLDELNRCWKQFSKETQRRMEQFIKVALDIINE